MSFKHHISNGFTSCRLLAKTFDIYRHRAVKVFALPGEFEFVGVSDGTDNWVAPVSINPFSCNVREILGKIQAGENPAVVEISPTGRNITGQGPAIQEIRPRRRLIDSTVDAVRQEPTPAATPQRRRLQA